MRRDCWRAQSCCISAILQAARARSSLIVGSSRFWERIRSEELIGIDGYLHRTLGIECNGPMALNHQGLQHGHLIRIRTPV